MHGEWQPQLFSIVSRLFLRPLLLQFVALLSCPLLCRCVPADSKSQGEVCEVSPLLSVLSRVMRRWTFAYMHVLWL